jgi:hypothetical protein
MWAVRRPKGYSTVQLNKSHLVFALIVRFGAGEEGSLFDIIRLDTSPHYSDQLL